MSLNAETRLLCSLAYIFAGLFFALEKPGEQHSGAPPDMRLVLGDNA